MAISYSWRLLIQRIRRHVNNGFPGADNKVTENEYMLYINEAMSFNLIGQVYGGAKITGYIEVPEAYIVTFLLPALKQDKVTRNWYSSLPQTPLSLPLGYSINRVYFANENDGIGVDCIAIKAKRVGRRMNMPMQEGVRYWVENSSIWFAAHNGTSLLNQPAYVSMPSTRAVNPTDILNIPDDAIEAIVSKVMLRMKERLGLPQDIIKDDLPAGNKGS